MFFFSSLPISIHSYIYSSTSFTLLLIAIDNIRLWHQPDVREREREREREKKEKEYPNTVNIVATIK